MRRIFGSGIRGSGTAACGFIAAIMMVAVLLAFAAKPESASAAAAVEANSPGTVYVIPVKQTIESGLASFLKKSMQEAEDARASLIVLDIDTPGGSLDSAEDIGQRIRTSKVPTLAFISGKAASAGSYLALNADRIIMSPGSIIGAAMVVNAQGEAVASPKIVSFWVSEMVAAAQLHGRNADIAAGMVDPGRTVEMKELGKTKAKGEIISLSADDALKVGYADGIAGSVEEALTAAKYQNWTIVNVQPTLAERLARVMTGSGLSTLLLIIGIAGICIELIVPGFGAPGIIGIAAFALYFFGQMIAGFAGMESVFLFIAGIIFILLEMFVPSFGILGLLGAAGMAAGIVTAAFDTGHAVESLVVAFLIAAVIVAVVAYVFRRRGVWNRFILTDKQSSEKGYVPYSDRRESLVGQEGETLSALRPAGVAEFEGVRVDVVTSGEFVESGRKVRVSAVDGTRVVVKEVRGTKT